MPKRWPADRTNRVRVQFLQVDSEVALTFAGIALRTSDEQKRRSSTQTARKAYDTIMRLRRGVELSVAENNKLNANLQRLKAELQSLGEAF